MKTTKEYRKMVEEKFGKDLKDIMYDLCVVRNVVPSEGANELGVPKTTFNYWRNYYRFGPKQILADKAIKNRNEDIEGYKKELKDVEWEKDFDYKGELSLDGFEEIIERYLKLEKLYRTKVNEATLSDINLLLRIGSLETILEYISKYKENKLYEEYFQRLEFINEMDRLN